MMILHIVSALALIASLSGNILVNYKKKCGFVVWTVSNILWIVVNFMGKPNYFQIGMFVVYIILNLQGYIIWNRKEKEK